MTDRARSTRDLDPHRAQRLEKRSANSRESVLLMQHLNRCVAMQSRMRSAQEATLRASSVAKRIEAIEIRLQGRQFSPVTVERLRRYPKSSQTGSRVTRRPLTSVPTLRENLHRFLAYQNSPLLRPA
jgi:hypothetical protein